jgi:hypothetical protein
VDPALDGQQELARGGGDREEGRVQPREGRLSGEDAELVQDVLGLASGRLGGPDDQRRQSLVGVGLAEQVERLGRKDGAGDVAAEGLGQVVPQTREDDAVQAPILRR